MLLILIFIFILCIFLIYKFFIWIISLAPTYTKTENSITTISNDNTTQDQSQQPEEAKDEELSPEERYNRAYCYIFDSKNIFTDNVILCNYNNLIDHDSIIVFDSAFIKCARMAINENFIDSNKLRRLYGYPRQQRILKQFIESGIISKNYDSWGKHNILMDATNLEDILIKVEAQIEKTDTEDKERRKEEQARYKQAEAERERAVIAAKIKEKHRRRQLEKVIRQELIDSGELFGEQPKRPPIPREIVDAVYSRDGGRCVYCGSTDNLQLDHIIPFSKGGATTLENLQLLCQKCNIEKSNKIG